MNPNTPSIPTPGRNTLGADVEITGTLKFAQELAFDGKLDGEIISEGTLTIGKSARLKGEVKSKTVALHGTVDGNITVTDRCELKTGSTLNGDLKACRIVVEEGATFIGKSEVTATRSTVKTDSQAPRDMKPSPPAIAPIAPSGKR